MASTVSAFGTKASEGEALSLAIRIIIKRKASDTVSPIVASTAAASSFTRSSIRARTTVLVMIELLGLQCSTCSREIREEQCRSLARAAVHIGGEPALEAGLERAD